MPWTDTGKNGFQPNPDFLNFPEDDPAPFVSLAKRCMDRRPKSRPQFSEIELALTESPALGEAREGHCGKAK